MKKGFGALLVVAALIISVSAAWAHKPFGVLYYDGMMVRTVVPPAAMTKEGIDPI